MRRVSMLLAGLVLLAGAAAAQYPDRPIVMIVPFPPGGVADTVARPVAEALGRELRQTLIVENKLGAGGALGIAAAARAPADGYTLLMSAPRPAEAGRPPWGSSKVAKPQLLERVARVFLPVDAAMSGIIGCPVARAIRRQCNPPSLQPAFAGSPPP